MGRAPEFAAETPLLIPHGDGPSGSGATPVDERHLARGSGWYVTFVALALLLFAVVDHFTGLDVVAATSAPASA